VGYSQEKGSEMLYGAIIGDIVGSVYEFHNIKTKKFPLFNVHGHITDDSCMTIAVANAISKWKRDGGNLSEMAIKSMREIGSKHPDMGYGCRFGFWLLAKQDEPYNSWGNGAAMRISAAGWFGKTISEVKRISYMVTSVSHDHIEGIKGAEATAVAIFLARNGYSKEDIADYIQTNYYTECDCVEDLRADYEWDSSCQGTVPPALQCFLESENFEDAIRNAISIGGDSDTIGAITGSVAEAFYGIPDEMIEKAKTYIPADLLEIVMDIEQSAK
jgi:type I restriction enzyme M protein